ncbi:uncharacterized protein CC84DRAFT_1163631 [Paraphaeosphaeria sporulosa]|uniref:Secreted protein n=1 Tax=Paraphaeosphaeria sporulosa TaxID=1460663 RepID=A0A177CJK2_9PLEO|nr:uncharacterized protein CC84DRAFT_1163631 [Paraphaeosphaeria sporulosa]OAG07486.1 hypothetical protein CC84DRAFT_1163631 [Paraphaeosphaeria sporulosa]
MCNFTAWTLLTRPLRSAVCTCVVVSSCVGHTAAVRITATSYRHSELAVAASLQRPLCDCTRPQTPGTRPCWCDTLYQRSKQRPLSSRNRAVAL